MSKPYAYPSDVTDEEWVFVLPYLLLSKEDSGSRKHNLRAVFDAYRYLLRAGCGWRLLPGDFPPWKAVYDQATRWHAAGVFDALIADLRGLIRVGAGRSWSPSAAVLDSRTLKSTVSSEGAAYDGAKRVKGRKLHLAVDTLGHLLAAVVSPADAQDRAVVAELCTAMQRRWRAPSPRPSSTRATRARSRQQTPRSRAWNCEWSSTPARGAGSCSCRGAGSWSARSHG